MGNLGRVYLRDWRFSEAVGIQITAKVGLAKQLGDSHPDTLVAIDNLAMAYFERVAYGYAQPHDLDTAVKLEEHVFQCRKDKLGREHVLTLWAGLNLARIKGLRGEIDEALAIFHAGHEIAVRNLGENHFAVLFGKTHHGRILTYAKRYAEAESVLADVVQHHSSGHPDRLLALFSLIKCQRAMGNRSSADMLAVELIANSIRIFGDNHPAVKYLLDPRNEMVESSDRQFTDPEPPTASSELQNEHLTEDERRMLIKYGHVAVSVDKS